MKLHYKKLGEEGEPLVILHGLFGSGDNWQTLGRKLSERYTVYLVDQRNHGHSGKAQSHTYDDMANDLAELFRELYLGNVHLVGHSMGGKTAIRFAQRFPHLLASLTVVDMGVKEYPMHHEVILEGLNALDLNQIKSRSEADKVLKQYIPEIGVRQFLLKNLYWEEKGKLGWRINLPVLESEMPEILKKLPGDKVEIPTLFVRGGQSNYILDEDFKTLEKQFVNSKIETIDKAGHWVHAEDPSGFEQILKTFLTGIEA